MPTAEGVLEWKREAVKVEEWTERKACPASWGEPGGERPSNDLLKVGIEQARRILELSDNWDGEGSPGYSEDTFNRATTFLTTHARWLWESHCVRLPVPMIGPGPDGTVDLHWKEPSRELLVNIPADANEMATFYGDNYGTQKISGSVDPNNFNFGIIAWLWLMN